MSPQRDALSEALREMAAASPEASPELGDRLSRAFARHHVRQRRKRAAIVFGLAACLVMSAYWLRPHRAPEAARVAAPVPQITQLPNVSSQPKAATVEHASVHPKIAATGTAKLPAPPVARASARPRTPAKPEAKARSRDAEAPAAAVDAGDFVALPTFDPAIPVGESQMVRMDLPGSALQLIGYPVDGQLLDRRILTDVLVGQDGMPYAVRLVQARNVH